MKAQHTLTLHGIGAVADYLTKPRQDGAGNSSDRSGDADFFGTTSLAEAITLARAGWTKGAQDAAKALAERKTAAGDKTKTRRTVTHYDVTGDDCDVARFCAGDPENMTEARRVSVKGKTVRRVNVSLNFSQGVSVKKIMEYAVAVCAAVQRIEAGGNRVELWVKKQIADRNGGPVVFAMEIRVKDAGSRMHPAALAFACGHPSFYRRFLFGLVERFPARAVTKISKESYGYTVADDSTGYLTKITRCGSDSETDRAIAEISAAK